MGPAGCTAVSIQPPGPHPVRKTERGTLQPSTDAITKLPGREWTYSENLNTGYTSNLISVQKKEDKYQIYFNGNLETSFFDNKKILIPGGRGFVAVVSSEEKFPEQSVKIRYRIKK